MPPLLCCLEIINYFTNYNAVDIINIMKTADQWKDYRILATSDGMKLEDWKGVLLLRPDPQVIWTGKELYSFPEINAVYHRSEKGGGAWEKRKPFPAEWTVNYKDLTFKVKPMGFKHTGLFPEQAVNWDEMRSLISRARAEDKNREIKILNLSLTRARPRLPALRRALRLRTWMPLREWSNARERMQSFPD